MGVKLKHAFENEYIIVSGENNIPANYIGNTKTSTAILGIIKRTHPEAIKNKQIGGELDACQIEIRTNGAVLDLQESQEELLKLFDIVNSIVTHEFGLRICNKAVPNQNFEPVYSDIQARYHSIHNTLIKYGLDTRKGTNVAGLHYHIDMDPDFQNYIRIAKSIDKLFEEDRGNILLPTMERHEAYKKVVEAMKKENKVYNGRKPIVLSTKKEILKELFDSNGELKFNYSYVGIKKPGGMTTEIRTMDAPSTEEDLIKYTAHIHNYVKDLLS